MLGRQTSQHGTRQSQSPSTEQKRLLRYFFELGIFAKGLDGGLELIGGLLLLFLSPAAIRGIIFFLVQGELEEDPTDLIANLLLRSTRKVIRVKLPASVFLIVHGVVKLALVGGLATDKLWSYPAAIVVFTGFTIYQLYQLAHQYSLFLELVTVLDVLVVILVIAEYRHVRLAKRADRQEHTNWIPS